MKIGGDNAGGTQWNCDNHVIYIHKLEINNHELKYTMSLGQKIKSLLGIGPSKQDFENKFKQIFLPTEFKQEKK